MTTIRVKLPFATFRPALYRVPHSTEAIPYVSTCYGFLLSLIGNGRGNEAKHHGVKLTPAMLSKPEKSEVVRRLRTFNEGDGKAPFILKPQNQPLRRVEILSNVDLLIFIDSSEQEGGSLETEVKRAILSPETVSRFGGLFLGDSDSIVDSVDLVDYDPEWRPTAFLKDPIGLASTVVIPDYQSRAHIQWERGSMRRISGPPSPDQMVRVFDRGP